MYTSRKDLPSELVDRVSISIGLFLKIEAAAGILLLLATISALIIANSSWAGPFQAFCDTPIGLHFGPLDFTRSLKHWVNDGLMTFFFFVIALELKRELILGELKNIKQASLPLAGAIGGMLFPVGIFLLIIQDLPGSHGWGVVMATDTAFVIGCLSILGKRIPTGLRIFLLSLAIFDDVGAILVVAIGYSENLNEIAIALSILGIMIMMATSFIGVRSTTIYYIIGIFIWFCIDASGIHATLTGVILGLITPTKGWISDEKMRIIFNRVLSHPKGDNWAGKTQNRQDLRQASIAARETLSPVERLEMYLHPWSAFFIMPLFALINAGVPFTFTEFYHPLSLAIFFGLIVGKPAGVVLCCWIAVRLGLAVKAPLLSWPILISGSLLTGIGFTMSLFIANLSFDSKHINIAKFGIIIASLVSLLLAVLALLLQLRAKTIEFKKN